MFGNFLKGKDRLTDADPTVRLEAVNRLQPQQAEILQRELTDLFHNDSELSVLLACVEKITQPDLLGALFDDNELARTIAIRIATLIDAGSPCSFDNHPRVLLERLRMANSEEQARTLIGEIEREISRLDSQC